jgi:hypothetical protein
MAKNLLTHNLSENLCEATTMKVDIDIADGNLTIDKLNGGEQMLADGTLQYWEKQGRPIQSIEMTNRHATLTLKAKSTGRPWLHMPWAPRNLGTDWKIHLNPNVQSDITVHSGGGIVNLDLTGMAVTRVSANTGGGNMNLILPDNAANLNVIAKTGAGKITMHAPACIAARIHATTGLGKVIIDPRFSRIDDDTYQSSDYDGAATKVEITVQSSAGSVSVNTK